MRRVWALLAALPTPGRWMLLGAVGLVGLLVGVTAIWSFLEQREARANAALAAAAAAYRQATAGRQDAQQTAAVTALRTLLQDHPRSGVAAQAWYFLGNLEYQRRNWQAAHDAFTQAMARDTGSIRALAGLALAQVSEARGDAIQALGDYERALQGRAPKDFLYAELLLGKARSQELLQRRQEAIDTYRKFLTDAPSSPRADEVRGRLALLGAS